MKRSTGRQPSQRLMGNKYGNINIDIMSQFFNLNLRISLRERNLCFFFCGTFESFSTLDSLPASQVFSIHV